MKSQSLGRRKLHDFLSQIEASSGGYCLTAYVKPSSLSHYITKLPAEFSPFAEEIKETLNRGDVLRETQRYGTGVVIFWGEGENKHLVLPPFPLSEERVFQGKLETSSLRRFLDKERTLGVALVTWGSYAVGVFKGDKLIEFKAGTGYIHKRTSKGGRSEKRFARRTEEQKKDFLRKVAGRVEEKFKNYHPEQIFFGGNRLILKPLLKECPYLESQSERISKRTLPVRYADRKALEKSLEQINQSLVFSLASGAGGI